MPCGIPPGLHGFYYVIRYPRANTCAPGLPPPRAPLPGAGETACSGWRHADGLAEPDKVIDFLSRVRNCQQSQLHGADFAPGKRPPASASLGLEGADRSLRDHSRRRGWRLYSGKYGCSRLPRHTGPRGGTGGTTCRLSRTDHIEGKPAQSEAGIF